LVINTTIPEVASALSCEVDAASGYTMALPPDTGTPKKSYFMDSSTDFIIAGLGTSGVGSLMTIRTGSNTWGVTQTHSGKPKVIELNPSANSTYKRLNWIQRR